MRASPITRMSSVDPDQRVLSGPTCTNIQAVMKHSQKKIDVLLCFTYITENYENPGRNLLILFNNLSPQLMMLLKRLSSEPLIKLSERVIMLSERLVMSSERLTNSSE